MISKLAKNGTALIMLNLFASALNYFCQLLMGRMLTVEGFGTINSIFSFLVMVGVPGATLTAITAKHVAESVALFQTKKLSDFFTKVIYLATLLAVGIVAVCSVGLLIFSKSLGIVSGGILIVAAVLAGVSYYIPVISGMLSGINKFVILGMFSLVIPVFKTLGVAISAQANHNDSLQISIILITIILGTLFAILAGFIPLYKNGIKLQFNAKSIRNISTGITQNHILSFLINLCLVFYMNIDILAMRTVYNATQAGLYSSVQLFGRIVYYFATSLVTVMLPLVAGASATDNNSFKLLKSTLLITSILIVACLVPLNLFPRQILGIVFGNKYIEAIPYIKFTSLISISLSLNTIIANYMLGIGKLKVVAVSLSVGCIITLFVVATMQTNAYNMLLFIGVVGFLTFLFNFAYSIILKRNSEI